MPAQSPGVYVVDDDEDIRDSLRLILEEEGYLVEEARDGLTALTFLETTTAPWIVLLDHSMPRLTGMEVLERLAGRPQVRARTAIIYLTARHTSLDEAPRKLLTSVLFAKINKPFDLDHLIAVVEQASQRLTARRSPA